MVRRMWLHWQLAGCSVPLLHQLVAKARPVQQDQLSTHLSTRDHLIHNHVSPGTKGSKPKLHQRCIIGHSHVSCVMGCAERVMCQGEEGVPHPFWCGTSTRTKCVSARPPLN